MNPDAGKVTLREYATRWLDQRADLRPRTVELYEGELRLHILPPLGDIELAKLTFAKVRGWNAAMLKAGKPGKSTVAKCYRLLHAIMNTAVADELIVRNPCNIKGAGQEDPEERPIVSVPKVYELADAIEPRFRAMVLIAAFAGLRLGEMMGLRRDAVDLLHGTIKVAEQYQELKSGERSFGPPKTRAGVRTVAIPALLKPELEYHLATFAGSGKKGLLFCGPQGQPLRRASWYRAWHRALKKGGIEEDLKPHDLRHTGNTLTAMTGASTKELMARLGQSSPRAALIYQHATKERDREIADALNGLIEAKLTPARGTGTERAASAT
jgi:integrase